jgi:hypothetical protein
MLKLFTLTSGKEVIGECVSELVSESWTIKYPLYLHVVQQGPDTYGLGLYPYSPSNPEGKHEFKLSTIQSESLEIPKDLNDNYIRETTGISIVSSLR